MKRILTIDDEIMTLEMLKRILTKENFDVIPARSAEEGLMMLNHIDADAVLLDVGLPDKDGFEVLKEIRSQAHLKHLPVFLVTARDEEIDTIIGLEIGADDYITKPFNRRELVARIKTVFRRMEQDRAYAGKVLKFGHVEIYVDHHQVKVHGNVVDMGQKEFKLLLTLVQSPNKVFTRAELLDLVWHEEVTIEERTVDVHIRRLRKKIETDPTEPVWIETVHGVGYRFSQ